jgi:hypothetical protein
MGAWRFEDGMAVERWELSTASLPKVIRMISQDQVQAMQIPVE